jgi:hypothetical protein
MTPAVAAILALSLGRSGPVGTVDNALAVRKYLTTEPDDADVKARLQKLGG